MPARPDICLPSMWSRHPDRMVDQPGHYLIVEDQTRKDRQAGRIRRSPAGRTKLIGSQVEDCARAGRPTAVGLRVRGKHLIENAVGFVNHQDVPIPGAAGAALDWRIRESGKVRDRSPRLLPQIQSGPWVACRARLRTEFLLRQRKSPDADTYRFRWCLRKPPNSSREAEYPPAYSRRCWKETSHSRLEFAQKSAARWL